MLFKLKKHWFGYKKGEVFESRNRENSGLVSPTGEFSIDFNDKEYFSEFETPVKEKKKKQVLYLAFGRELVELLEDKKLRDVTEMTEGDVYMWDSSKNTPIELVDACVGWHYYTVINNVQYRRVQQKMHQKKK